MASLGLEQKSATVKDFFYRLDAYCQARNQADSSFPITIAGSPNSLATQSTSTTIAGRAVVASLIGRNTTFPLKTFDDRDGWLAKIEETTAAKKLEEEAQSLRTSKAARLAEETRERQKLQELRAKYPDAHPSLRIRWANTATPR